MACISKLAGGFAYDCDTGATGLLSAIIINKGDIASYSVDVNGSNISSMSLVSGATAFKIDTPKKTLTASDSLKVNENAPNAFSQTVTLISTGILGGEFLSRAVNPLANGSFVVMTRSQSSTRVYGLYFGLSASSIDRASHENGGWVTITLTTPEACLGEDYLNVQTPVYDSLYAAAVY